MIPEKENTRLSKLLSKVLRHNPELIGIELDEKGWTDVNTLLAKLANHGETITTNILQHVVSTNVKQRFRFSEDATMIRANQGHSVEIDLDYPQRQPPEFLYHGTVDRFIPSILKEGLKKMERHHVHLSADTDTAIKVGQRRGKPVILKIKAGDMFSQGRVFCLSANGVWLTDSVAPEFVEMIEKKELSDLYKEA